MMVSTNPLVKIMASVMLLLCLLAAGVAQSEATVYKVGGSIGWTTQFDYTAWASGKTFHTGDTLLFIYNKEYHSVLEVKEGDYSACDPSSPLAKYTSGNDSITIETTGNHYYICSRPGHCGLGQRLYITAI